MGHCSLTGDQDLGPSKFGAQSLHYRVTREASILCFFFFVVVVVVGLLVSFCVLAGMGGAGVIILTQAFW